MPVLRPLRGTGGAIDAGSGGSEAVGGTVTGAAAEGLVSATTAAAAAAAEAPAEAAKPAAARAEAVAGEAGATLSGAAGVVAAPAVAAPVSSSAAISPAGMDLQNPSDSRAFLLFHNVISAGMFRPSAEAVSGTAACAALDEPNSMRVWHRTRYSK